MKKNIDIIRDYLDGVRPITMVGYTGKKYAPRTIGETWTDNNGQEWIQEKYGPRKVNKTADTIRSAIGEQKCKCGQNIKWGNKSDQLFYRKTNLCEECLINYETKLTVLGIYNVYEQYKLASNELGAMLDMKNKIQETINYFKSENTDVTMLCNSEGFIERWKTTNVDQILENANEDLKQAERFIDALKRIQNEQKEKYINACEKYKLEIL